MAPFFGASTIVWANTIAVVLVALSIGYWFGGRMADRRPDLRSLCLLVLVASVLLGLVPIVAQPFLVAQRRGVRRRLARRRLRLAARRAGAGRDPGADAGRGLAVGDPAQARADRGLRRDGRADVRDLDRRLAAGHVPLGAAADPARRHPAHVPRLRARARRRRDARPRAPLGARAARRGGAARAADRHGQGGRRGPGDPRDRDRVPVRAGDRPRRTASARSSSTRARRSTRSTGPTRCSPAATGTASWSPRSRSAAPAAAGRDARLRRRDGRPRLRALLPGRRIDGVEIDSELSDIGRRYFGLRPRPQLHDTPRTRGRSCAGPTPATTSSSSTRTASPTSRSTSRRTSSSSSPATASRRAGSSWSTSATLRARTRSRRSSRRRWARPSPTSRATRWSRPTRS